MATANERAGRETGAFVYVANNQSGDISVFGLDYNAGELRPGKTVTLDGAVMPIAASPDRRFLYAEIHNKAYSVVTLTIDPLNGSLEPLSTVPLPENMVYLCPDATGRFLLGASYHGDVCSVNPIGREGFVQPEPVCVMRAGRHAHSILPDPSNRFVYVAYLGNDQMAQLRFDEKTGRLAFNSPAAASAPADSGPRHFCFSPNGRFAYLLTEMAGTVVTYSVDGGNGQLLRQGSVSFIPPGSAMEHGLANYYSSANIAKREAAPAKEPGLPKIWAADIHVTPDGRFVYASERANSTISWLAADAVTGKLVYGGCVTTEKQPRSFGIDPRGRFLVASGEKSEQISLYEIDGRSGALDLRGRYPVGKNPGWVEIVPAW